MVEEMRDEELLAMFERCSNAGRWGKDDELGTLNYVTADKRVAAAALVRMGTVVAIGQPLSTGASPTNPRPAQHLMLLEQEPPLSALDFVGVAPHGYAVTHLDAVAHVFWEGRAYNGRRVEEVLSPSGLRFGSIHAQRQGIFTRGVLLDVAAAAGKPWLSPGEFVTVELLESAEQRQGVRVGTGDAVFVRVGLGARCAEEGPENPAERAGLHAGAVAWLHEREVAVYSGDCVERVPYPSARFPLPLHQIGLAAMGLCLLDCPEVEELATTCSETGRFEFLLTCAPFDLPGGTGAAVNPLCLF
jgi:kynurenine formamidase